MKINGILNLILLLYIPFGLSQENCVNGTDDDGDTFIDMNDSDCSCTEENNLIPNGDFEEFLRDEVNLTYDYPQQPGQITKAAHWLNPTNSYDINNAFADAYHTDHFNELDNVEFPSGNGAAGISHEIQTFSASADGSVLNSIRFYYNELLGNNLSEPLQPGNTYIFSAYVYRKNFNDNANWPQLKVALWGKTEETRSFRINYASCPQGQDGFEKLISLPFYPKHEWLKVSGEYTVTEEINGIIVGIDCGIPVAYYEISGSRIMGFDNISIQKKSEELFLTNSAPACASENILRANTPAAFTPDSYQWYKDGIALNGETGQTLTLSSGSEEAYYSVRAMSGSECRNSAGFPFYKPEFRLAYDLTVDDLNNTVNLNVRWNPDNYLYSADGVNFISNPVFSNIPQGENVMYVQNQQGCIVKEIPFSIFQIYNIITPNGDGFNDTWDIKGIQHYPGSVIQIFDKHGVEKQIMTVAQDVAQFSWDGKVNGRPLSSGTYWYLIQVSDGRKIKGSLTIKRQN